MGRRGATAEERKAQADFDAARYHQPADEWEPARDHQPLADFAHFQFLVGRAVAERPDRPHWKRGDFFERFVPGR